MLRLTKKAITFVLMTFVISYACFIFLALNVINFNQVLTTPTYIIIFGIGCLGPFISALIIMASEKTSIIKEILTIQNPKMIYLILLFLALHYSLATFLHLVGDFGSVQNFIVAIPSMIIILGLSEIGWRKILFKELIKVMGIWRANICVGLFTSICFIPLVYIPGFLLTPNYFLPFSVYIVGMGILSTTIYLQSGAILYSVLFVGLFSACSVLFQLNMGNALMIMFIVDLVIGIAYNSKALNKSPALNNCKS